MRCSPPIRLPVAPGPVAATIRPPGSKSLTHRALLLAALADGESIIDHLLLADDTRLMIDALRGLGVPVQVDEAAHRATVTGCAGRWPNAEASLYCGNAGTVLRFLTAACTIDHGMYRLDGSPRMRERPIGDLVDSLRDLGAEIGYAGRNGFCPVTIRARRLRGGTLDCDDAVSSQHVSALLMAGALASDDVMLSLRRDPPSRPYIGLTLGAMSAFGVEALEQDMRRFIVPAPQAYHHARYAVEPDATAASYFFAAAAVTGGRVTVEGLGAGSRQGDMALLDTLIRMGCEVDQRAERTTVIGPGRGALHGVDVDYRDTPDVVQTLAVVAAFAEGPTRIQGVGHLRIKETDRLIALAAELGAMGVDTALTDASIVIRPAGPPRGARIRTYGDHRMAMSFAVAGLRVVGMEIQNPACVEKSYPAFFADWAKLASCAE